MVDAAHETQVERVESELGWTDLVCDPATLERLEALKTKLALGDIRRGIKSLFHGPRGTGKALAARLLGAECRREVYRIDLSTLVSKYIGETEKHLDKLFRTVDRKRSILLFDEADALFGKRSDVKDAHDRYASLDTVSLLQRIEAFDGVVIVTTNASLDGTIAGRFDPRIEFFMPAARDREKLWRSAIPEMIALAPDADLQALAEQHELSGGSIHRAVKRAVLRALSHRAAALGPGHLAEGVRHAARRAVRER